MVSKSVNHGIYSTFIICSMILAIIFVYQQCITVKEASGKSIKLFSAFTVGRYRNADQSCGVNDGKLIYVKSKSAMCIDGSKAAYYLRLGKGDGLTKWNIFFEGGGWCYNMDSCVKRSREDLGSSMKYPKCKRNSDMKYYQSSKKSENPLMFNWNTIHIKYCDGGSYAGDSIVVYHGKQFYFKGQNNREAIIQELLHLGMKNATDIVLSGCSAGGLGIILGIDAMVEQIRKVNRLARIRGLADSAFFIDHSSDKSYVLRVGSKQDEAFIDGRMDYAESMRNVFNFMNMSAGTNKACLSKYAGQIDTKGRSGTQCVFTKNNLPFITTPLFMVQPRYDQWQIWHVFGGPQNSILIRAFGNNIVDSIKEFSLNPRNGAFIDSCTHHCTSCSNKFENTWNGVNVVAPSLNSSSIITPAIAFLKWYNDETLENMSGVTESNQHIYIQSGEYPCPTCCVCHA